MCIRDSVYPVIPVVQTDECFLAILVFCLNHDLFYFMRSEEHTSELQSHSEISYAVFCLKK